MYYVFVITISFVVCSFGQENKNSISLTANPRKQFYQNYDIVYLNCAINDQSFESRGIYFYRIKSLQHSLIEYSNSPSPFKKNIIITISQSDHETQIYCSAWPKSQNGNYTLISEVIRICVDTECNIENSNSDLVFISPTINSTVKINDIIPINCESRHGHFNSMELYQQTGDRFKVLDYDKNNADNNRSLRIQNNKTITIADNNTEIYCCCLTYSSNLTSSFDEYSCTSPSRLHILIENEPVNSLKGPKMMLFIAIPIGATLLLILIIVLICAICKNRQRTIKRPKNLGRSYEEIVKYADIQSIHGSTVSPVVVAENTPYAEVVGFLGAKNNIYSF